MKKLLTAILASILAVAACFGLTACTGAPKDDVVNPRTKNIVVGYTKYEPMNYYENGVLKGFDTELAIMTFEALGYNVKFELINWSNKYVDLNEGRIDCIWNGFTSNGSDNGQARNTLVDFSYNYMQNAQCIVRLKTTAEVTSRNDFAGKSICFEQGSSGDSLANSYKTNGTDTTEDDIEIFNTNCVDQMAAITNVKNGMSEYAIVDILLAETILEQADYADLTINQGLNIDVEYYAVGFSKGSELTAKVNAMFKVFAETGVLQELAAKYKLSTAVLTNFN